MITLPVMRNLMLIVLIYLLLPHIFDFASALANPKPRNHGNIYSPAQVLPRNYANIPMIARSLNGQTHSRRTSSHLVRRYKDPGNQPKVQVVKVISLGQATNELNHLAKNFADTYAARYARELVDKGYMRDEAAVRERWYLVQKENTNDLEERVNFYLKQGVDRGQVADFRKAGEAHLKAFDEYFPRLREYIRLKTGTGGKGGRDGATKLKAGGDNEEAGSAKEAKVSKQAKSTGSRSRLKKGFLKR